MGTIYVCDSLLYKGVNRDQQVSELYGIEDGRLDSEGIEGQARVGGVIMGGETPPSNRTTPSRLFPRMVIVLHYIRFKPWIAPNALSGEIAICPRIMQREGNQDAQELLEAIESPGSLRPRDRLALGLGNSEKKGVYILYQSVFRSLEYGDTCFSIRCLEALSNLCKEVECSELLGVLGGHAGILCLMSDGNTSRSRWTSLRGAARNTPVNDEPVSVRNDEQVSQIGAFSSTSLVVNPPVDRWEGEGDGEEDEVQIAAANVAFSIASSGCPFPMRAASVLTDSSNLERYPVSYVFDIHAGGELSPDVDSDHRKIFEKFGMRCRTRMMDNPLTVNCKSSIEILIRTVKERQHSQFDVGFQMWPAAVILSRWMCAHPEVLRARRVLEIGAGLGLCGLVAAHFAPSVTLSDFNPLVLRALEANVALNVNYTIPSEPFSNDGREGGADDAAASTPNHVDPVAVNIPGGVSVRHLDWNTLDDGSVTPESRSCETSKMCAGSAWTLGTGVKHDMERHDSLEDNPDFKELESDAPFDLIIASDHICQESDAEGTIRVLRALLARGGEAHLMVAHPRTRFGVDALPPLLEKYHEFEFTCEEVKDPALTSGLEEAEFLAWLHVHVWYRRIGVDPADSEQAFGHLCLGAAGDANPVLISG